MSRSSLVGVVCDGDQARVVWPSISHTQSTSGVLTPTIRCLRSPRAAPTHLHTPFAVHEEQTAAQRTHRDRQHAANASRCALCKRVPPVPLETSSPAMTA